MDSADLQCSTSNPSKRGRKRKASSKIQSKRARFLKTYQRQSFSLPDSITFYVAKNSTSLELYLKKVQTCKEFFVKNPILVIPDFEYCGNSKWKLPYRKRLIDLSKISSKFLITDQLYVEGDTSINKEAGKQNTISNLMSKLYHCDAKFVNIYDQIITLADLSLLISSAEEIDFINITVQDKDGNDVGIEKIVEIAVKAKEIEIRSYTSLLNITSNTMKELIKPPHFSKLINLLCMVFLKPSILKLLILI